MLVESQTSEPSGNWDIYSTTYKQVVHGWTTYISAYLRVIFFVAPHTHVLCMVSGSAIGYFPAVGLVHSLPRYFI